MKRQMNCRQDMSPPAHSKGQPSRRRHERAKSRDGRRHRLFLGILVISLFLYVVSFVSACPGGHGFPHNHNTDDYPDVEASVERWQRRQISSSASSTYHRHRHQLQVNTESSSGSYNFLSPFHQQLDEWSRGRNYVASDNVTLYSGLAEPLSNYSALPPKGFSMCGSMEPSHDDLYQMAVAHAELEGEDTHFDNEEDVVDIFWHDEESEEDPLGPTTISPTRSRSSRQQGVNVRTLRGPTGHAPSSSSRGRKLTKPLMDSSSQTIHALNSDNENDNNPSPNRTAYHIPVYFHLFLDPNNDNAGYLSRKDINRGFMKHLRQAFSRTNAIHFEFVGMTLTYNHNWFQCKNEHTYKSRTRRGGPETLNVFICDMAGSLGLGGNAHLPPTVEHYPEMDGVNIMNPALGGADFAYQAFVHEVGHWMGLLHTFADGCRGRKYSHFGAGDSQYPSYFFAGDGIRDTAAHARPTWEYPQKSTCWQADELDTCNDQRYNKRNRNKKNNRRIDRGLDPVNNYMNYLPAQCFNDHGRFTRQQFRRMYAQYRRFRAKKD